MTSSQPSELLQRRPRMLYFQRRYEASVPGFLMAHLRDHLKCLELFFDVTVIREDADYGRLCDTWQPDLAVFETGPNLATSHRLRLDGIGSHPQIPRLALLNCDAWCETRSAVLQEMAEWRIDSACSIAVTAAEHLPGLAGSLFVWPNFVDPAVFRDHGEHKLIPVLLTGAQTVQYPWRRAVFERIAQHFPALKFAHPGYYRGRAFGPPALEGEAYARTLNAARFAPACGTLANEVVRKHFEIPACRSCLVTQASPGLRAAGFEDMVNCVFVDAADVLDKLDHLFRHPEELQRITDAGHALVQARHTLQQRDELLQWWRLQRGLPAGQCVTQARPFAPLAVAQRAEAAKRPPFAAGGLHLHWLRQAGEAMAEGRFSAAEQRYQDVRACMPRMAEATLGLALCRLRQGDADGASAWIAQPIDYTLIEYGAARPDPLEWAVAIRCLLCAGRGGEALRRAAEYPEMRHPELDRMREAVSMLAGRQMPAHAAVAGLPALSAHAWAAEPIDVWRAGLCEMLAACGQHEAVARLRAGPGVAAGAALARRGRRVMPAWRPWSSATGRRWRLRLARALQGSWLRSMRLRGQRR